MRKACFSIAFAALLTICLVPAYAMSQERTVVRPAGEAASSFPISPGIAAGGFVFASGQLGFDPATNKLPAGIEDQTKFAMENLKKVLEAGGSSLDKAVKINIYLKDLKDFDTVTKIYATYFTKDYPARTCLEVSRIPADALIEIEGIGMIGK